MLLSLHFFHLGENKIGETEGVTESPAKQSAKRRAPERYYFGKVL